MRRSRKRGSIVIVKTQSEVIASDVIAEVVDLLVKSAGVNGRATSSINELSRLIFERGVPESRYYVLANLSLRHSRLNFQQVMISPTRSTPRATLFGQCI